MKLILKSIIVLIISLVISSITLSLLSSLTEKSVHLCDQPKSITAPINTPRIEADCFQEDSTTKGFPFPVEQDGEVLLVGEISNLIIYFIIIFPITFILYGLIINRSKKK